MAANGLNDDQTRSFTALVAGTIISHYKIISKIGAGGMGEVYLAEDTQLNRKVALKFLPPHVCYDEDCRKRFTREAKAAARLDHPNIVQVFEVGEFQGRPFFAMAHIEGKSLREVIKEGKLSINEAIEFTKQICEGLYKAHESGVIHRDIKPGNIIIDKDNKARILDFGLATVAGEEKLTKTGSTLGTIGYMSPEQIEGKKVDHRSDLFSVGVILYEMLTGRRPFERDNDAAVYHSITTSTPEPIARYKSGATGELQQIVDKALAKDASLRYQHADGMLSDLKRHKIIQSDTKKSRIGLWAAVAVVMIAGVFLGYNGYFSGETDARQTERKMLAVLPFENLGGEEDEVFADGITDAITSRIANISGLGVIARTSVLQYKGTTKRIGEIGAELSVGYILEGTILWDKSGDTDRVRIIPQLIQVSDESHLWAETYERAMTGIFQVQADIASTIAEYLKIELLQKEREALEKRPTENMEAYQAYLIGRSHHKDSLEIGYYERAVELDSNFALAFAALSWAHSWTYIQNFDHTADRLSKARASVERALELDPALPEAHLALGYYYYWGFREYSKALIEFEIAEKGLPNDPRIPEAIAYIWRRKGRFEEALRKQEEAFRMNPSDVNVSWNIVYTLIMLGEYSRAMQFVDNGILVHPERYEFHHGKFWLAIHQGDLIQARATLLDSPPADWSEDDWIMLAVLERDYQTAIDHLIPYRGKPLTGWAGFWIADCVIGSMYQLLGDSLNALRAFDSARVFLESHNDELCQYYGFHSALGIAYAGLGRKEEAIREGRMALDVTPITKDAIVGSELTRDMAKIYTMVGEYDLAIDLLEQLLNIPNIPVSITMLRLHPDWDPLRDHPRFKALISTYSSK